MKLLTYLFSLILSSNAFAILNGAPDFHPRLVSLGYPGCKGVLFDSNIVLTAAHCIMESTKASGVFLHKQDGSTEKFEIEKILKHPHFNSERLLFFKESLSNDIAIIQLKGSAKFDSKPLLLFQSGQIEGFTLKVYGGKHDERYDYLESANIRSALMLADTNSPIFEANDRILLKPYFSDDEKTLRICKGDSGGPSIMEVNGEEYLVGITSYQFMGLNVFKNKMNLEVKSVKDCLLTQIRVTSISRNYEWIIKTIQELRTEQKLTE